MYRIACIISKQQAWNLKNKTVCQLYIMPVTDCRSYCFHLIFFYCQFVEDVEVGLIHIHSSPYSRCLTDHFQYIEMF